MIAGAWLELVHLFPSWHLHFTFLLHIINDDPHCPHILHHSTMLNCTITSCLPCLICLSSYASCDLQSRVSQPLCQAFAPLQQLVMTHSKVLPSLPPILYPVNRIDAPMPSEGRVIPPSPPMPDEVRAAASIAASAAAVSVKR